MRTRRAAMPPFLREDCMTDRDAAIALLCEYTKSESLRKHALTVEAAMRWYAKHFGCSAEEVELWGITGLLHDFDYERWPDIGVGGHPFEGNRILTELNYPEEVRSAIMGHTNLPEFPRESKMAKTLFAVDELCGFVIACALVRPDKSLAGMEVKSVKKKLKDKAFAKGCNRDDIKNGAAELGIELDAHIANTLTALRNANINPAD